MLLEPYKLAGNHWVLELADEDGSTSVLGASLQWLTSDRPRLIGTIDAIAAAAKRLGRLIPFADLAATRPNFVKLPVNLRDYQKAGITELVWRLREYGGALLADDMGLGKTRQAIVVAMLLTDNKASRVLIIGQANVRETWLVELKKNNIPDDEIFVHRSGQKPPKDATGRRWVVTSYDLADKTVVLAGMGKQPPTIALIDEVQNLAGRKTKRKTAIQDVVARCTYKLGLSGTPMADKPRDLYQPLRLLLGTGPFGRSPWEFDRIYCGAVEGHHGGLVYPNELPAHVKEELALRLSYYMVRRLKRDVSGELPALTRHIQWLDANPAATRAFQIATIKREGGSTVRALIAAGAAKIDATVELALTAKRFLVLTWTKEHCHAIAAAINEHGGQALTITGEDSTKRRQAIIAEAIATGAGIVATIESVGTGVDGLQHVANVGIMHTLHWKVFIVRQGEKRIDRMGQTLPVDWYYPVLKESMDARVLERILGKLDSQDAIIGDVESAEMKDALGADSSADEVASLYDSLPEGGDDGSEE